MEYNNRGEGANAKTRVNWSKQLSKKEAALITLATVFNDTSWLP
jgi:pectinesterase